MSGATGASTAGVGGPSHRCSCSCKDGWELLKVPCELHTRLLRDAAPFVSHPPARGQIQKVPGLDVLFFSASSLSHKVNTVKKKKKKTEAAVWRRKRGSRSTVWLHAGRPSVSLNGSGRWKCLAFLCEPLSDRLAAALRATVTHGNTTPGTTTVYSVRSFMYKYSVHIYICHLRETTTRFQKKKPINILRAFVRNQTV